MMKKSVIGYSTLLLTLVLATQTATAQQGFGTDEPSKASAIEMASGTRGLLLPRVALTSSTVFAPIRGESENNIAKTNSLLVYNTATSGDVIPGYYYWTTDGTTGSWNRLLANNDAAALQLAGDVTGTLGASKVEKIQGSPVSATAPSSTNQVLTWNGTAWEPKTITPAEIGSKANLSVQDGIAITAGSGTNALLGAATIGITNGGIAPAKITPGTTGQVLTTNGSGAAIWSDKSSLITGVSNTSSGNNLTTTVNGTTGTAVNIINSNTLTLNGSNQLVSTVNGQASTALNLGPAITAAETETSMVQNATTGVITYNKERNGTNTANVLSATSGNILTYSTGAFLNAAAVKNAQQNTIVAGSAPISVAAPVTVGNNTTYTVSVGTANTTTLGVVRQADTNPTVNVTTGVLSVNTAQIAGSGLVSSGNTLAANTYNGLKVSTTGGFNDHIGIGGSLNEPTTITATSTNTFAVAGLQTGTATDNMLVADPTTGVLKKVKATPRFFYMPAVIFDTSAPGTALVRDLYLEYKNQFEGNSLNIAHGNAGYSIPYTGGLVGSTGAPADIATYASGDLYYYVSYYDQTVFSNLSIDATGKLTYTILAGASTTSYMNIVFVVKE
ncbi:hypothetical protein [Flavobacterium soli]|uniref:hypothetical protein n=1 Tax=Flavobacterium soli TaxID=344881 RepID=UPI0003FEAD33|nr:hypothetical protein [Flavobacterium soli]